MTAPLVLFVDDEAGVVSACKRALRREPWEIRITTSADEALQLIAAEDFAVVVSDQRMPAMDGAELLRQVSQLKPDTVRIILTGHADIDSAVDAINRGHVFRFLGKPWNDEDLKVTIAQAVDQYTLVAENRRLQLLTQQQNEELRQWNASLENRVAERTAQIEELSGRLEASLMGSIETLARVTEMHSSVVGSHSKRVESLSVQISHQLGMDGDALRQVRVAALLHDIGKIAVPGHVLQKRVEQMLPDERDQLREHVSIGESIVREMPNLGPAAQIIRHHHERCDGSGYPDNLTKDMIPIGARIVAVADAWDKALNDKRQFEHATSAKAMDHLLRYTPAWFDKTVVDALQQCLGRNDEPLRLLDQEIDISANDLVPGMVLAHEVRAANGLMLLPAQTRLTEEKINRLRSFSAAHPLAAAIRVVRPRGEVTAGC